MEESETVPKSITMDVFEKVKVNVKLLLSKILLRLWMKLNRIS